MTHRRTLAALTFLPLVLSGCAQLETGSGSHGTDASTRPGSSGSGEVVLVEPTAQFAQERPDADGALFNSGNTAGQIDLAATTQYVSDVIGHADTIWTSWFLQNGLAEPWVSYHLIQPGQTYTSACNLGNGVTTVGSDHPNAWYCPADFNGTDYGTLILPLETFAKMWSGEVLGRQVADPVRVGDFAAAAVVAHEFGHHVQDELAVQLGWPALAKPNSELIADCFAGVWAYSAFLDSYLEAGDLEEALAALDSIGDASGSHGTGAERQTAFQIGFSGLQSYPYGGVPANCISTYWPAAGL